MGRPISPQQFADRWLQGMQNGVQRYKEGVQNPSKDPIQAAIDAKQKYLAGVQEAFNSGRYEQGLRSQTQQSWTQAALERGANRIAGGAAASKGKVSNFAGQFLSQLASVQASVNNMPSDTYEQRQARARAMADGLHALKGKLKG